MKFGLLGYGSIGQRHAKNLRELGHQVVVYDPAYFATHSDFKFERQLYDSDVDGVIIASPTEFHEQAIRACVERCKPMLIEKPIATHNFPSLQVLLDHAKALAIPVMMGNNLRFHLAVRRTKTWLADERYGKVNWATFTCAVEKTETAKRDGVLLNVGSHEVDLAMHLLGPAEFICGDCDRERADFVLRHDSGIYSMFHLDIMTDHRVRKFIIGCERRSIIVDLDERCIEANGPYPRQKMADHLNGDYKSEMVAFVWACTPNGGSLDARAATGFDGLRTLNLLTHIGEHCA